MGTPRLRGSEQLDPLLVPLPNGTQVATRVERLRASDGAVRADSNTLELLFVAGAT